jgi:SpoVK/Ycf46/Vps4 family AAA+-type ATPase
VRALLTGPSGTGKTLAARLLAAELGMDLYRVDLASVINKYVGETEKNLHRVLSTAEELDVVLLLDEGDALLGRRTEVSTANDRYANVETDYLLQRLEHYSGIVLVTSNLADNIDPAFQRRMDRVVDFSPPSAEERLAIWSIHLPEDHAVDESTLRRVARECALNGGQIRNAAQQATLLALDDAGESTSPTKAGTYGEQLRAVSENVKVRDEHVVAAVREEYQKDGAVCPLTLEETEGPSSGAQQFVEGMIS